MTSARRRRKGWRRGAAALEFAIISIPFVLGTLSLMELCYNFYVQEMLDFATQNAARQIQIGAAQSSTGGALAFIQKTVCTTLTGLLPCSSISYSSQVVTDFFNLTGLGGIPLVGGVFSSSSLTFCPGRAGQLVLLTTYYPQSAINIPYFPASTVTVNGQSVHMIVSTAAFMNEQFGSSGAASGC